MTFWSALILGLVASAHCIGMCAGLQTAMQTAFHDQQYIVRSSKQQAFYLLLLNLGRIFTYATAGLLFSAVGAATLMTVDIPFISYWLRFFTGLLVLLIGVQVLFRKQRPFQFMEPLGVSLWKRVSRLINHSKNSTATAFINGIAWGFLPCGLVYGVLLSTVLIQQPFNAAMVMVGFGLGTMPALVLTGAAYQKFRYALHEATLQGVAASVFIVGGIAIMTAPHWVDKSFLNDYPILLNTVFCLSEPLQ